MFITIYAIQVYNIPSYSYIKFALTEQKFLKLIAIVSEDTNWTSVP